MSSVINAATVRSVYGSLFAGDPNWLADTFTAIQNAKYPAGLMGMLQNARGGTSNKSFMQQRSMAANNLALISQNSVADASSLIAQIASENQRKADEKKLQDALNELTATQNMVKPENTLDPFIFFSNGSTLDTNNNILTMADGTQIDTTTGAKYVDTSSIIQMANGAYLDTKNNILTLPDGTRIDTVTGLNLSVTA